MGGGAACCCSVYGEPPMTKELESKPTAETVQSAPTTKNQQVIHLLRREGGATLEEMSTLAGWLPALASEHRRCRIRMAKLAKLACLAPDILTMILNGKQPVNLTPCRLLNADLPLGWDEQKRVLGFA